MLVILIAAVFTCELVQFADAQKLALTVRVAYFSGRRDPVWKVTATTTPNYANIIQAYNNAKNTKMTFSLPNMANKFGYRGFVISENGNKKDLKIVVGLKTKQLQKLLLQSAPKGKLNPTLVKKISSAIDKGVQPAKMGRRKRYVLQFPVQGSGSLWYNPFLSSWLNNCYNYANDRLNDGSTGTGWAEPGIGGGQKYTQITKNEIKAAAIRDGLVLVPVGPGGAIPHVPVAAGHLVALYVAEGGDADYHWFRRDGNGQWSHKQGMAFPTNKDLNGALINDPRTAAVIHPVDPDAPQYQFVCFMSSNRNIVNIQGEPIV